MSGFHPWLGSQDVSRRVDGGGWGELVRSLFFFVFWDRFQKARNQWNNVHQICMYVSMVKYRLIFPYMCDMRKNYSSVFPPFPTPPGSLDVVKGNRSAWRDGGNLEDGHDHQVVGGKKPFYSNYPRDTSGRNTNTLHSSRSAKRHWCSFCLKKKLQWDDIKLQCFC